MVLYVILMVCFFIFGYNAGCLAMYTQLIEVGLSLLIFALVISVVVLEGFVPGAFAVGTGLVIGHFGYRSSPGLRR